MSEKISLDSSDEKYTRTGEINDNEYPCSEMMGWTASTFLRALEVVRHTSVK